MLLRRHLLIFVFISFFFNSPTVLGQDHINHHPCGTEASTEQIEYLSSKREDIRIFTQSEKERMSNAEAIPSFTSIPVKIHVVRRSNGTGGLTTTDVNNILTRMNSYYHNAQLDFYMCGAINFINSDNYWDFDGQTDETGLTNAHDVANVINMYFTETVKQGSNNLCGYAYFPPGPDHMFMANQCSIGTRTTVEHEMGHYLGLYHTHGKSNCGTTNELVNGSNCAIAGDDVCDTPADPNLLTPTACNAYLVNSLCVYTGGSTYKDANNQVFAPHTRNIMSYSRPTCRNQFTANQYVRARYFALRDRNYITCSSFNVDFTSNNELGCDGPRTVNFTTKATGASTYKWHFGDGSTSTVMNPSHSYANAGTFDVALQITDASSNSITAFKEGHVDLSSKSLNYTQNFNSFDVDDWAASLEDKWRAIPTLVNPGFRWNVWTGSTPSSPNTGPTSAYGGSGNYVYTEASFITIGSDSAMLVSPCFNLSGLTGVPFLEFYYHMFALNASNSMGSLHLDANTGSGWIRDIMPALVGRQQNSRGASYQSRRVSLLPYATSKVRFRFRGQYIGSFQSDMAVDNFRIFDSIGAPLNTELIKFSARRINRTKNQLSWFANNNQDIAEYRILKSKDRQTFFVLDKILSSDIANNQGLYLDLETNDAYYKVSATRKDGSQIETEIQFVEGLKANLQSVKLHPNPTKGIVQISDFIPELRAGLLIADVTGKPVLREEVLSNSAGKIYFDISNLIPGVYLVELRSHNTFVSRKLIKF